MNATQAVVTRTDFNSIGKPKRGKVRDIYELGETLLIVASDRISAFDVVFNEGVPLKGKILTQLSLFWFRMMGDIIPNHVVSTEVEQYPSACKEYAEDLSERSMLVAKASPFPVECVVRGYLSGSGWQEYRETGRVCGIELPKGLAESSKLPTPIFTPATKEEVGKHDMNISFEAMVSMVGKELAEKMQKIALRIYTRAAQYAESKGIIIADTKMEFGLLNGELILIDELLTPDASRFWPAQTYRPGGPQLSYDKQFVRDYLVAIHFQRKPPPPPLPPEVIEKTTRLYAAAYESLTGSIPESWKSALKS